MVNNKYELASRIKEAEPVMKETYIVNKCRNKMVLDLGCIRHNAEYALKDPAWLHAKIKEVAAKVTGVDYLLEEIEKLKKHGYDIIFADVTQPMEIKEKYDVIVAGDLIEHLLNVEGFFVNCRNLLKSNGMLIITTPNPFYSDEFHYVSFKNNYLVNPEHTCWIDPQCLSQLSKRMGFDITELYFIKHSWELKNLICETKQHQYDILNGRWLNETLWRKIKKRIVGPMFGVFYSIYKKLSITDSKLVKYSDYLAVLEKKK